jgi:hypothetical protein
MKNNVLWYLSPIAFALLAATWISHANLNNGTYAQNSAVRTIQSTSASGEAHCISGQVSKQLGNELDENVTTSTHPMRVASAVQCPR